MTGDALGGDDDIAAAEFAGAQPVAVERIFEAARQRRGTAPPDQFGERVRGDLVAAEIDPDPAVGVGGAGVDVAVERRIGGIVEEREEPRERIVVARRERRREPRAEFGERRAALVALGFFEGERLGRALRGVE